MNTDVMFSKNSDEWQTPPDLYKRLDETFHFELDPCTTIDNPLHTKLHYIKEMDGLRCSWHNLSTFVNPPYSQIKKWVNKVLIELQQRVNSQSNIESVKPIVMLVPARTDTQWFHSITTSNWAHVVFLKGRLKFVGAQNSAPFPSSLIIFSKEIGHPPLPHTKQISCYKLNLKEE